ncbi:RhoGAP domain-containing protein [Yersinia mollaretii]|uniref:RhoGAP domain n=1 Tax=Yersinia mollaretii TaxID=33060 RepID=A0AA36LL34_YERMO|nr:RhoGAP domain-containing protein [Yersinia mollaretii]CNH90455.1 RhoGAP domain [Yersinia mollaretii]
MKIYEGQKHRFYLFNKPYYKDSYSIKDLDKHYNKNALSGKFSEIKNITDTIRTHSNCAVIDLKSCNTSTNNITMGKKILASIIKSISPIRSFIKSFTSYTKVENKVPKNENALGNLTRLIHYALGNESFFSTEGIFRLSSTSTINNSIQEALSSNNNEQIAVSLKEIDAPTAVAAKIKEHLGLALSDDQKMSLCHTAIFLDKGECSPPAFDTLKEPLKQLIPLLAKVANNHANNKMNVENLAIVFTPSLLPDSEFNDGSPLFPAPLNIKDKVKVYEKLMNGLIDQYNQSIQKKEVGVEG